LVAWNGENSRCGRAVATGNNEFSGLRVTRTVGAGNLTFRVWVSSQEGLDGWRFYVNNFLQDLSGSGVPTLTTPVSYPASLSSVLAVGASSDFDYRSDFSQYGPELAFVTPGGGGLGGIVTTDRTGTSGYGSGDYTSGFAGTSASAPIAAGVAALALSKNGNQSPSTVIAKLKGTCDKVDTVAYSGTPYTRNDYYGCGRLNAYAAVSAATADTTAPTYEGVIVLNHRTIDVLFSEPMGEGVLVPANYSLTAGQGTLATHPSKVLRMPYTLRGDLVYRLIWNSGSIAESGTVTLQVSSSVKDVAGNGLSGTLSQSSSGTKRLLAVNCGDAEFGVAYTDLLTRVPFTGDGGFQGNEYTPFQVTDAGSYNGDDNPVNEPLDGTPLVVYQSQRKTWSDSESLPITYSLPDMPAGNLKVKLHFAETDPVHADSQDFDIYINGNLVWSAFNILDYAEQMYTPCVLEISNITRDSNNKISVSLIPVQSMDGYGAAICGVEVVKP